MDSPALDGGLEGGRTPDLLRATEARYQLRHKPRLWGSPTTTATSPSTGRAPRDHLSRLGRPSGVRVSAGSTVPPEGFEPPRPDGQRLLRAPRLPIPPGRQAQVSSLAPGSRVVRTPNRIRTGVIDVKGRYPGPLDDGGVAEPGRCLAVRSRGLPLHRRAENHPRCALGWFRLTPRFLSARGEMRSRPWRIVPSAGFEPTTP